MELILIVNELAGYLVPPTHGRSVGQMVWGNQHIRPIKTEANIAIQNLIV